MERQFGAACYNGIKTAFKLMLGELGGIDAAASCTRVRRSQLADYGQIGNESFAPADVIMDLEQVAGTPHVTAALARAQGFVLVPIEPGRERGVLSALLAEIGRDVGELFATAAGALQHGSPSDVERETMLRELDDLRRLTTETIGYLSRKPSGG